MNRRSRFEAALRCATCWPSWRLDAFCSNTPSTASVAAALPFTLDDAIDAACDGLCLLTLHLLAMSKFSSSLSERDSRGAVARGICSRAAERVRKGAQGDWSMRAIALYCKA